MADGLSWPGGGLRGYVPESRRSRPPVTSYVADFITNTRYPDLPPEVIELAKKSILDGIGLALCGSVAQTGEIVRTYLRVQWLCIWRGAWGDCDWLIAESSSALCGLR